MEKFTRRAALRALSALGATTTLPMVAAAAARKPTPDERIEAAMKEIEAAFAEKYPGWHVQRRNDMVTPLRYVSGGPDEPTTPQKHAVLLYAYDPGRMGLTEEAKWFVNYL